MKEKIREVLWDFVSGELTDSEAAQKVLELFAVEDRSDKLKAFLSQMIKEFDEGEVSYNTRDSAENLLKSF